MKNQEGKKKNWKKNNQTEIIKKKKVKIYLDILNNVIHNKYKKLLIIHTHLIFCFDFL